MVIEPGVTLHSLWSHLMLLVIHLSELSLAVGATLAAGHTGLLGTGTIMILCSSYRRVSLCLSHEHNTRVGGWAVLPGCVQEGFIAGGIGVQEKGLLGRFGIGKSGA